MAAQIAARRPSDAPKKAVGKRSKRPARAHLFRKISPFSRINRRRGMLFLLRSALSFPPCVRRGQLRRPAAAAGRNHPRQRRPPWRPVENQRALVHLGSRRPTARRPERTAGLHLIYYIRVYTPYTQPESPIFHGLCGGRPHSSRPPSRVYCFGSRVLPFCGRAEQLKIHKRKPLICVNFSGGVKIYPPFRKNMTFVTGNKQIKPIFASISKPDKV